jgi:putative alpha-1,2-mannosidase
MRRQPLLVFFIFFFVNAFSQNKQPVDYADPLLGTSESRWMLNPGATMPFGMVQLAPDNQGNVWKSGYEYTLNNIGGFSHIHSWTMAGLSIMPTVGELNPRMGPADGPTTGWTTGYRSRIDKTTEKASPGYYAVKLLNGNINVELTSTTRAGFFKFNYTEDVETNIIIDLTFFAENTPKILDAQITKVTDTEIQGYSKQRMDWNDYTVHFAIRFNKPIKDFGGWIGDKVQKSVAQVKGAGRVGGYAHFEAKAGDVILMQTGISLVSVEQAKLNLETEMNPFNWSFEACRDNAKNTWNKLLSKITVEGGTEENKKKF